MGTSTAIPLPVAHAGDDQTVAVRATVRLDGSASTDVAGHSLSYAWTLLSAPSGSAATLVAPATVTPSFVVDRPGDYVVQLVVRDAFASSPPDMVRISTTNSLPVAHAGCDQTVALYTTVELDGTASSDPDGDPLAHQWTLLSMPAGSAACLREPSSATPSFVVDVPGDYAVQLVVRDPFGSSRPDVVRISTINSAPVAHVGVDQTVAVPYTVRLDGSASSDVDGDPLTYRWALLSAPSGSETCLLEPMTVAPSLRLEVPGTYVIQLIVNDGHVDSHPDTVSVVGVLPSPRAMREQDATDDATARDQGRSQGNVHAQARGRRKH